MNIPIKEVRLIVPYSRITVTVKNECDGYGPANMDTVVEAIRHLLRYTQAVTCKSGHSGPWTEETQIVIVPHYGESEEDFQRRAESRGYIKRFSHSQAKMIEDLRRLTGCSLIDCKDAAEKSEWDLRLADAYLKTKGLAYNIKRA